MKTDKWICIMLALALMVVVGGCKKKPAGHSGDVLFLHTMVARGNMESVRQLIAKGADVNGKDGHGRTALHVAVGKASPNMIQFLLDHDAKVNARDENGGTPLHEAAGRAPLSIIQLLMSRGADVNTKDKNGRFPLDSAFHRDDGADVAELFIQESASLTADHLIYAAQRGYMRVANLILDKGISPNSTGRHGDTPLHAAVSWRNMEIARLLVTRGAHVNARSANGRGAGGGTPLHIAARQGTCELARWLLSNGADIQAQDENGETPLHAAVRGLSSEVVELLVGKGADINARNREGDTPVLIAVEWGRSDMTRVLVDAGADVGMKNVVGSTILHVAVEALGAGASAAILSPLIAGGADVNAGGQSGFTPLHCVARDGHVRAAELLIAAGADVNARTAGGQTPLHLAIRYGHYSVAELLVAKEAEMDVRTNAGKTPLDCAREAGREDLAELLTGRGNYLADETQTDALAADVPADEMPTGEMRPMTDVQRLVRDNSAFALDLYDHLRTGEGNLFFSPYSVSTALALAYAGARENTAKEIADAVHFSLDPNRLHPAFAELQAGLNKVQEAGEIKLHVANSLWPQKGYGFLPEYLSLAETSYDSHITPVDFTRDKEEVCATINKWVEAKTANRIRNLVQPDALGDPMFLVLVNAIYFKGAWKEEFDPEDTRDDVFYLSPKQSVQASFMRQQEEFRYAQFASMQIVELPYRGDELSMLILLPARIEGLQQLEESLSTKSLDLWRTRLQCRTVEVFLPKFRIVYGTQLTKTLGAMGMKDAFVYGTANFAGMDGRPDWLFIGGVIHKAFVEVNEEGTEAAVATAVGMLGGLPAKPPEFRADHPFLFLIQDNRTGSILFLGRVVDPK